jgi:hypothetical protein
LFTCLLNSPRANYKSKHLQKKETKHTHKLKAKQGNLYHLNNNKNSVSAITPTIMQWVKKLYMYHTHIHAFIVNTISILITEKVAL